MTSAAPPRVASLPSSSPTSWPFSLSASSAGIWRRKHGTRGNDAAQGDFDRWCLARRFFDLLPDSLDGAGELQDRAGGLCDTTFVPVFPLDHGKLCHGA